MEITIENIENNQLEIENIIRLKQILELKEKIIRYKLDIKMFKELIMKSELELKEKEKHLIKTDSTVTLNSIKVTYNMIN